LVSGIIALQITAVKEEKKLQNHDQAYKEYMKKTGRFFPKYF
jgi:protein-S-isoprenylcysteine O-methyltransferase Ste14